MAFQPFGYRFEIRSRLSPEAAKAAIRVNKQVLFDAVSGPRGWVIGPFVCLWMYAFLRTGPMLIGIIRSDEQGSRVRGRAGSDLNGMAYTAALLAFLVIWLTKASQHGDPTNDRMAFLLFVPVAALCGLLFWAAHSDRWQADPLVDFLQQHLATGHP